MAAPEPWEQDIQAGRPVGGLGYHGDVRPRVIQGGGDRVEPGLERREAVPRRVSFLPEFDRDRAVRPLVKPERFDGTEDWTMYLQHFEWCALLNRWTEEEKAGFLMVSVTGAARQALANVGRNQPLNYSTITRTLQARFDSSGRLELDRLRLKNRQKQKDETLSALADDVKRLVDRVFADIPDEAREKLARDNFIDALTDSDMRIRIIQMRTRNIQEAMEAAIELETLSKAESERNPKRVRELQTESSADQEPTELKDLQDQIAKLKKQLQSMEPNQSSQTRQCYNCGDTSHMIRDCPKPRKDSFKRKDKPQGN